MTRLASATTSRLALAQRWERLPVHWRRALVATLVLRAGLAVLAFAAGGLLPGLRPVGVDPVAGTGFAGWVAQAPAAQGFGLLGAGLERFDALWYLAIARDGYPAGSPDAVPGAAAFFPGYPLLVGLLGRLLGGAYLLAGSLVSLAATVAALAGVHRLVEVETADDELARRALVAAAVFPSAFFLVAAYTEALFLALTVWALVLAREGRFLPAAGLAFYAGLTRNVGVLLALPLLLEGWRQRREGLDGREGRSVAPAAWVAAVAAAPAGLLAYLGFGWWRFGTPLAPVSAQVGWQRELTSPLTTVADGVRFAIQTPGQYATGYHTLDLVVVVPVLAAVVWVVVRTPLPYGAYAAAHALVWLAYPFPSRPFMSVPRFALAVAPLFWAFAVWTRRRGVEVGWLAASATILGVHALLFVTWYYVF